MCEPSFLLANNMFRSPLEWAFASRQIEIARLLLEKGSRVDHVSAKGWTPVFNLFGYEWLHGTQQPSCLEYLQLLSAAGFSDWNIQDTSGWTVMHGAAYYGTAEDVAALVNVGASVSVTNYVDQTPIRLAVIRSNTDTFSELAKHLSPSFINEQDKRGWAPLHQAALMGNIEMLNLLFQYEPDPHLLTFYATTNVPKGLERQALSAIDIAKHQGEEHLDVLIEALGKAGHDIALVSGSSEDEKNDLFWPALAEKVWAS